LEAGEVAGQERLDLGREILQRFGRNNGILQQRLSVGMFQEGHGRPPASPVILLHYPND
jgi:hypothetical protein